jgi:hypothetical protein
LKLKDNRETNLLELVEDEYKMA